MRKLLVLALAALLLAACGATGAGSSPSPSPTSPSGFGYAVVLTQTDHAATLRVGQKLEVVLRAAAGATNWTQPASSDESVLAPTVDPAATAARGVTLAAFLAMAPGQAVIHSTSGPLCPSGAICPMYAIEYSATVTVTG